MPRLSLAVLVGLAGCAWSGGASEACPAELLAPAPPPGTLVRVEEGRFLGEAGEVFVPRGVNSYPLLDHAGRGRADDVRAIYERAVELGRPLIRTPAFLDGGTHPGRIRDADLTLREEGLAALDLVLALAREHGVRLLLYLTNHWADYGGGPAVIEAIDPSLPVDAVYSDPRAVEAQTAYAAAIVSRVNTITGVRYGDDPTVFAWELVNEPRCDDARFCGAATLVEWARAMAGAVRAAGARQPIAWGGVGFAGEHGEDLEALAADGAVEILTLHLYPGLAGAVSLGPPAEGDHAVAAAVRDGADAIRHRASIARRHGRALLVEEAGWRPIRDGAADQERALVLGAWSRVAAGEGLGLWPWMIAEPGRPDYDGFLIDPDAEPASARVLRCE